MGTQIIKKEKTITIKGDIAMFEKLKALLVEELQVKADDVTLGADLREDLGINSLELADLVLLCEEKFETEIDEDDIRNFITVGDIQKIFLKFRQILDYLEFLFK